MSISTLFSYAVRCHMSRGLAIAGLIGLSACQQVPSRAATPSPPEGGQKTAPQAATTQPSPQPGNGSTTPAITFHLAQAQAGQGLVPVQLNQSTRLYAVPQPVFTQGDLRQIVPIRNNSGQVFLRFDFNQGGAAKLAKVTREAQGNYLIISAQRKLIAVPRITAIHDGGSFPLPVSNVEEAQAIIQLIRPPGSR